MAAIAVERFWLAHGPLSEGLDDAGAIHLVVSPLVIAEIRAAPPEVREFFQEITRNSEQIEIDAESIELQQASLHAGVVSARWEADALHVALATVSACRCIVSWNFKHIVNFKRIPLYNEVNEQLGYAPIAIHTPPEVAFDDK